MMGDADLVRACLEGDPEGWKGLLDLHGPSLLALVRSRLSGRIGTDPEGVFQDLWVSLLEDHSRRLRGWDASRPLKPYLSAIALNLCRDHLGLRRPSVPLEVEPQAPSGEERRREAREEISKALMQLDRNERLAMLLVEADGLSYAEAARVMQVAEGTVGSLLTRARERLKKES